MFEKPVEVLASYHYFEDENMAALTDVGCRIVADSGAFSAYTQGIPIDMSAYHKWVHQWNDHLLWASVLDVIGDQDKTRQNWDAARADGLDLVPALHYGEPASSLDYYADNGATLVALGGMVPYNRDPKRLMRWLIPIFKHARDHHPQIRFHGFGVSNAHIVDRLPWWSCDASTYSSVFMFGTLTLFNPDTGRFHQVRMNGVEISHYRDLLNKHYNGIGWRLVSYMDNTRYEDLNNVTLRSMQLYQKWVSARQQVEPPELIAHKVGNTRGPVQVLALGPSTRTPTRMLLSRK